MSTLVLLAHPDMAVSRANGVLAAAAFDVGGVTVHDLYATYPGGNIDVATEQALVEEHESLACAITTGAPQSEYEPGGWNRRPLSDFMAPLEGTANFCRMRWREPFVMYGVFGMSDDEITEVAVRYQEWLSAA